jgi:protein ImuB
MRCAAVTFFRLRVELAQKKMGDHSSPLAVVVGRGAVVGELSLLGNTRIDEVSPEAWALGVRPGFTIAAARAKTADLCVRVVHARAVEEALGAISEMGLAFGATTAFAVDGESDYAQDVVFVDVTGCAHLHATAEDPEGERTLAARWQAGVRALGYKCRVAIAAGPRIASAVARWDRSGKKLEDPIVVPPGKDREVMARLPIAALPLSAEAVHWLRKLGLKTVLDLRNLPKRALGTRLGKEAELVMPLLEGEDATPLEAYVPPHVPEERAELEYGIESTEALLFVAKMLSDRMAVRLAGRCMSASRIELRLALDKGIEKKDPHAALALSLATPLYRAQEFLNVLRARIESYEITAPVVAVTLRCTELVRREGKALDLFVPEARAARILPRLSAELSAEIGEARVGILALCNSWVPGERTALVPYAKSLKLTEQYVSLVSSAPEPVRLLCQPVPYDGKLVRLFARGEAVEWWKRGVEARTWGEGWARFVAPDGVVDENPAWVEVDRFSGARAIKGWMD